jgi:glycerol uptake facilitator-like aquaporin
MNLARRLVAETLGSALLLAIVVGSAIMADRLAGGNAAVSLLANSLASAAGLLALILTFGGISGAHFNPVVTLSEAWHRGLARGHVLPYLAAQVLGAFAGVAAAHVMFGEPALSVAVQARAGAALWWSEFVATFGLVAVISGSRRNRPGLTPFAVAAYIGAAYWFTASSSFANPALTLARAASSTVAGIRLVDAWGFVAAQVLGAVAAICAFDWLHRPGVETGEAGSAPRARPDGQPTVPIMETSRFSGTSL